jgi:hypothetical protein
MPHLQVLYYPWTLSLGAALKGCPSPPTWGCLEDDPSALKQL